MVVPVPETQQAEGQVWDRRVRGLGLGQVGWGCIKAPDVGLSGRRVR